MSDKPGPEHPETYRHQESGQSEDHDIERRPTVSVDRAHFASRVMRDDFIERQTDAQVQSESADDQPPTEAPESGK